MTPELKTKWLAALRSGAYEQGQNYLHDGVAFCCLGVLCEVAGIPKSRVTVTQEDSATGDEIEFDRWEYAGTDDEVIDDELADDLGLTTAEVSHLVSMNDGTGSHKAIGSQSFSTIAAYIEREIPTSEPTPPVGALAELDSK